MAEYFAIAPVTLTLTVVVGKKTAGGKLAATDVMVTSIDGKPSGNDGAYYAFAGTWGDVVLNYKAGGRPAKPVKDAKPAPKALTAAQVASIPGPATKPAKGKGKVAAAPATEAPAAPAAPDMAAIVAAVIAALGQK